MAVYTVTLQNVSGDQVVSLSDGSNLAKLEVNPSRGPKGDGWTGVTYSTETGRFTFTSNDGLGYVSDDITVDLDAAVAAAQAAQTGAEAAEAATEALFDQFGDQYLGPKASDPTVDNDGNPLVEGAIYFNTTDDVLKFYSGTAWVAPESVATTAAAAAQASASAAATSESNAATSESNAATSESNAATSETNAANSASAAAASATEAQGYADSINPDNIDINGGTIDNTVIGGSTPAAISGTTGSFSGNLTVDTNTLFVDAANNRVGVGTTTPTHNLTVGGTAPSDFVVALRGGVGGFFGWDDSANSTILQSPNTRSLSFQVNSDTFSAGTKAMSIAANGDISFYEDTGTTPKFFWDASAERLGIGTSTMFESLRVIGPRQNTSVGYDTIVTFVSDDAFSSNAGAGLSLSGKYNTAGSFTAFAEIAGVKENATDGNYAGALVLKTRTHGTSNITERMRIDSSGNLLVGKTSSSFATDGGEIKSNGQITATASNAAAMQMNRRSSDGTILNFARDGSTVGSIASDSGSMLLGSGDVGVYFDASSDRIIPMNMSTLSVRNDAIDLGGNPHRFKNLYLSGGVYLGGTGSANYLDDYEEGTFSPTILGSTTNPTVTYGSQSGKYLKIGSLVWVSVAFHTTAVSGGSGAALLGNLPFTATSSVYGQLNGGLVNVDVDNATYSLTARVLNSSSTASFQQYRDNTNDINVLVGDLSGGTKFYQFSGCYSIQ